MNSNTNSNTATGQTQLSNRTSLTGSQRFSSTIYVQGMEYMETLIRIHTIHTNVNGNANLERNEIQKRKESI